VRDYSLRGESGSTRLHPEFDREFQKYFDHAGAVNNYPLAYSISGDTARAKAAYNFESAPALFSLFAENLVAGPRCSTRDGHWGLPPGPRPLWNPSPIYTSLSIDGRLTDGEDEQDEQSEQDDDRHQRCSRRRVQITLSDEREHSLGRARAIRDRRPALPQANQRAK